VNRIKVKHLETSLKNKNKAANAGGGVAIQEQVIQEEDKEHESNSDQRSRYLNDEEEERKSFEGFQIVDKSLHSDRSSREFDRSPTMKNDPLVTP
jgi:hypothetical protein